MRYSLCVLKWKKRYVEKCSIQCFLHLFAHNNIGRYIKLFCKQQKRSSAPKTQPISIHFIIWKGKKSSVFTESFLSSLYVLLKWKKILWVLFCMGLWWYFLVSFKILSFLLPLRLLCFFYVFCSDMLMLLADIIEWMIITLRYDMIWIYSLKKYL